MRQTKTQRRFRQKQITAAKLCLNFITNKGAVYTCMRHVHSACFEGPLPGGDFPTYATKLSYYTNDGQKVDFRLLLDVAPPLNFE